MTPPYDLDFARPLVGAALHLLEQRIHALNLALLHEAGWFSVPGTASDTAAATSIARAYEDLNYDPDAELLQTPRLGVACVRAEVLALAESVNEAKAALRTLCVPMQAIRVRDDRGEAAAGQTRSRTLIRRVLADLQRNQLNLLAAYRRIPVLAQPVVSIAYTRAQTRSVYRKSVRDVARMIERSERPGVADDRARLTALPPTEGYLALVRERYENLRANVVLATPDPRGRLRLQVTTELPFLCLAAAGRSPPRIAFPRPDEPAKPRKRRASGLRLEGRPFLATLPVFRYRRGEDGSPHVPDAPSSPVSRTRPA